MADRFRLYFLIYYGLGIVVALITVAADYLRSARVEQRPEGAGRYLLPVLVAVMLLLPPLLIFVRAGEIAAEWVPVRILGVAMSLYTAGMELWIATALGRFLVARAVVFQDHALVTHGPYRFLRHPDYSGLLALWLGAGLGALNGWLLVLFPLFVIGMSTEARLEERLLESKFGEAYRMYARDRRRFIPRLGVRAV
jgi:protein-S-isoprenylcysteine O-methyltransferase Ste14